MRQCHRSTSLLLALQLCLMVTYASVGKSATGPEKETEVEQTVETSPGEPQMDSQYCKSELDKKTCNAVNESLVRYFSISNHIPPGYYERNYKVSRLIESIESAMQRTIEEGQPESLNLYAAFINFVKFKEKTEVLFGRQNYDEADSNRKMAFKYHNEIIDYCKPCVDVMK